MFEKKLLRRAIQLAMDSEGGLEKTAVNWNTVGNVVNLVSAGLGAAVTGMQLGRMIANATTVARARNINVAEVAKVLTRKNPQWDKEEVMKYLVQLKLHVPEVLLDPYAVEEVVRRAILYGGLDPSYIEQLKRTFGR